MTFVERTGAGAAGSLRRLAQRLDRDGVRSRLLRGQDDPGRFLLVVEDGLELAPEERAGARVWRFRDAGGPESGDVT